MNYLTDTPNEFYDGKFYLTLQKFHREDNIYVITGPGSYTKVRKNIAVVKAIQMVSRCNIYGIDILLDYLSLFSFSCAFVENNFLWKKDEKVLLTTFKILPEEYISNLNFNCSLEEIYKFLPQIEKKPPIPLYFDKFS